MLSVLVFFLDAREDREVCRRMWAGSSKQTPDSDGEGVLLAVRKEKDSEAMAYCLQQQS